MYNSLHLGIVDGEFSIVAWLKLPTQSSSFDMIMAGMDEGITTVAVGAIYFSVETSGNIKGIHYDFESSDSHSIESSDQNVADNKWHHIAFTKYSDTYFLFIDGEEVKSDRHTSYMGFVGDNTFILIDDDTDSTITGSIFIDELGFFETGFSIYEIEGLYEDGLSDFLEAMPVNPEEKVATTWGEIKTRRY